MIEGGKGGANTTKTGLKFERDTDVKTALEGADFQVVSDEIYKSGNHIGQLVGQHKLYKFVSDKGIDWRSRISKRLLPDEAVFASRTNSLTIVEKKWQQVAGSVDEKLQTCGFKLRQYRNLTAGLGIQVKYVYLLSDWFAKPEYDDVRDYIKEVGADYHFKSLPLELFDF